MGISTVAMLAGIALYIGIGGDDGQLPAPASIEGSASAGETSSGTTPLSDSEPAVDSLSTFAGGPTAHPSGARSTRSSARSETSSRRTGTASAAAIGSRGSTESRGAAPNSDHAPFSAPWSFFAEKLTVNGDGTFVLSANDDTSSSKPEIPSGGMTITQMEHDSSEIAAMRADSTAEKLDIKRLGYIELAPDEAARLGIIVTSSGLELLADDWKDAQIRDSESKDRITLYGENSGGTIDELAARIASPNDRSLKRFKLEIVRDASKFAAVAIPHDERPLPIAPVVIVNQRRWSFRNESSSLIYFKNAPTLAAANGELAVNDKPQEAFRSAMQTDATVDGINAAMSHALGRLVPVYFRFDEGLIEGSNLRKGADVCLWYAPTKEFLAALPDRYRISLESELSVMCEVAETHGSVDEACDRIAGKPSYLEVCRVSSGAVNAATATPNPAHGRTTVGFRLSESRRVSITLHDLNGRYLRHLVYDEERAAGEHHVEADLDGVSQGAYLVAVRTNNGEQAVARLIVQ
jgi:hypothetical protein